MLSENEVPQEDQHVTGPIPAGKVRLRHPHTGDTQDVNPTTAEIVPLMNKGYSQVHE